MLIGNVEERRKLGGIKKSNGEERVEGCWIEWIIRIFIIILGNWKLNEGYK